MTQPVSDQNRDRLQAALAAALTLIFAGKVREALDRLGQFERSADLTPEQRQSIDTFARERAQLVQSGIYARMGMSPDDMADPELARQHKIAEIANYNRDVLIPYMTSWAVHQAQSTAYDSVPAPNGSGTAKEATQWVWIRGSGCTDPDPCGDAEGASPAAYDDLVSIAGSEPPVHSRCQCSISPA